MSTIEKKINHIFTLIERLARGEELYPQHEELLHELGINERTLRRYLEDIHSLYGHMVLTEKKEKEFSDRKVTVYRVVDRKKDVSEVFRFLIENSTDLNWVVQMLLDNDPELVEAVSDKQLRDRLAARDGDVFLFVNNPFEHLEDEAGKKIFSQLKTAVKHREYRTIHFCYDEVERIEDAKCLKLLFMNNNWYLAIEDADETFRFLRLAFIHSVEYGKKTGYQAKVLEKYAPFFTSVQNSMTLNAPLQSARLMASARVAKYFMPRMKPFFPSQRFEKEEADGNVIFTLQFTQSMEVLPFIKQWQPDITVLSPENLKNTLREDLALALERHI